MSPLPPEEIARAIQSPRWAGLVRLGLSPAEVAHWDPTLIRQPRVLVPVDLQALYVEPDSDERFVRLPFALTSPDGEEPEPMPAPLEDGTPREPGVHLHWAPPDALLRGSLDAVDDGSSNRLGLPALPDRWVVLRIVAPAAATAPAIRGWVLEADTARAVPLDQWPDGAAGVAQRGRTLRPEELTGTAGGSLAWAGVYDAVRNRLSFHDPLDDLRDPDARVFSDIASYVVAGWWSQPELDPLDAAHTSASLQRRLEELRWRLVDDREGADSVVKEAALEAAHRAKLGVLSGTRYGAPGTAESILRSRAPVAVQLQQLQQSYLAFQPARSLFADLASSAVSSEPRWPRSALLHGVVHGVPVRGEARFDQRPDDATPDIALGHHGDDVTAALAADRLEVTGDDARRSLERTLAAFTGQLLRRLGTEDGVVDIDEHEHAAGFQSLPGGTGAVERLRPAGEQGPLPAGRSARSAAAARAAAGAAKGRDRVKIVFGGSAGSLETSSGGPKLVRKKEEAKRRAAAATAAAPEARLVRRPLPRFHLPVEPVVGIRGAKRSLRHGFDGRFSPDGLLHCRWPAQVPTAVEGVVDGARLVPRLDSGALPGEVVRLVRSAVVSDPYLTPWLADVTERLDRSPRAATETRLAAEALLRYGADGTYDGSAAELVKDPRDRSLTGARIGDQLRRFSLVAGVDADPVGVTAWSQPWIPLWLEWEIELAATDRLEGWSLGPVDLEPGEESGDEPGVPDEPVVFRGRSALHNGGAVALASAIDEWKKVEDERDRESRGEADEATERALAAIADAIERMDLLSATLEGVHERLLGLPVDAFGVVHPRNGGGTVEGPVPVDLPRLLVQGALRLTRARVVDAFGRTLELPAERVLLPAREELDTETPAIRIRPRLVRPARWMFRLVDPSDLRPTSPEATVDQIDPESMINPVAGFLLPDHIDEALEVFDTAGAPLGQLMHEPFGGGVVWEIAPGRQGPPDAGPGHGLDPAQQVLALAASGLVASDAATREGRPAGAGSESSLSALLRAIDTTLWTVDTFSGLGTEHIAGLVGRPVAVVRATLRLEIDDDLDELDLSDEAKRIARERAYAELADRAFPVRIGELTRADDGLLAFFLDDDYSRVHVVDRAVRDGALDTGRGRGQLGQYGTNPALPGVRPIDHPYIVAEDELRVRPGQVVRLTLLMHPAGRVHLTSGILPRKALALARDWVRPGLAVMAPSVRVGPVLIDPGEVRLPKVSVFPKDQLWTRRDTPSTWKDDPILAATQTALLPTLPHEVQEGYIRISQEVREGLEGGGG